MHGCGIFHFIFIIIIIICQHTLVSNYPTEIAAVLRKCSQEKSIRCLVQHIEIGSKVSEEVAKILDTSFQLRRTGLKIDEDWAFLLAIR